MGLEVVDIIFYCVIAGVISILGSTANVINIIIFFQQGFKDSTNISLFGLAISDLLIHVTLAWTSICNNPLFQNSNIEFDSLDVEYVTAGWPQACLFRVTSWITAYITFQRCVCIALPMKVQDIITPKGTSISIIAIFMSMFTILAPEFATITFDSSFNIKHNKTMISLFFIRSASSIKHITISLNVVAQLSSFIIVFICTTILVLNLIAQSNWRLKIVTISSSSESVSIRDKRVMKMITCISCIFILLYFPALVNLIMMIRISEYSNRGLYKDIYSASWAVFSTLQTVNSAISILVYYNMSSKFKTSFHKLFMHWYNNVN